MESKESFSLDNFVTERPIMEFVLQNGEEYMELIKKLSKILLNFRRI